METLLAVLTMIGIIILGFVIAELVAAHFNKQVRDTSKIFFSKLGIIITQKDFIRFLLSLGLGFAVMIFENDITKLTSYDIPYRIIYLIVGISPTTFISTFSESSFPIGASS